MAIQTLTRVFVFEDQELPDPDPKMTDTEVLDFYSNTYPELNVGYVDKTELDGNVQKHFVKLSVGTKA